MKKLCTKVVAMATALFMGVGLIAQSNIPAFAAGEENQTYIGTYGGAYNPETILSDYQLFAKETLSIDKHTVGSIAAGDLSVQEYTGEVQLVSNYAKNITSLSAYSMISGSNWYASSNKFLMYETTDVVDFSNKFQNGGQAIQNTTPFINMATAFDSIKKYSDNYVSISETCTASGSGVEIDIPTDKNSYFVVNYADIQNGVLNLKLNDINVLKTKKCVISICGINAQNIELDYTGDIKINGVMLSNKLKELTGGEQGGQFNLGGMNLIWNLPDATGTVSVNCLSGHLVAPNATVKLGEQGGNYEGGVIAKNISTGGAEGHFYPCTAKADPLEKGDLIITIRDEETNEVVPGAEVKVTDPDGDTETYITDVNGQVIIEDTMPGEYTGEVTDVPGDYTVTEGATFTAEVIKDEETEEEVVVTITATDKTTQATTQKTTNDTTESTTQVTTEATTQTSTEDTKDTIEDTTEDTTNDTEDTKDTTDRTEATTQSTADSTEDKSTTENGVITDDSAKTGDSSNIPFCIMLLAFSVVTVLFVGRKSDRVEE